MVNGLAPLGSDSYESWDPFQHFSQTFLEPVCVWTHLNSDSRLNIYSIILYVSISLTTLTKLSKSSCCFINIIPRHSFMYQRTYFQHKWLSLPADLFGMRARMEVEGKYKKSLICRFCCSLSGYILLMFYKMLVFDECTFTICKPANFGGRVHYRLVKKINLDI